MTPSTTSKELSERIVNAIEDMVDCKYAYVNSDSAKESIEAFDRWIHSKNELIELLTNGLLQADAMV